MYSHKKIKSLFVLLGIFLFVLVSVFQIFPTSAHAQSDDEAVTLDRFRIVYKGAVYVDREHDTIDNFVGGPGSCSHDLDLDSPASPMWGENVTNATVTRRHIDEFGDCSPISGYDDRSITVSERARSQIYGYRHDANNIYVPASGFLSAPSGTLIFRRASADTGEPRNRYFYVNEDGNLEDDKYLDTGDNGTLNDIKWGGTTFRAGFILANNGEPTPVPGAEGDEEPPTPPGSGDDGDASNENTCESNISSSMSWIICGVLSLADGTFEFLLTEVNSLLSINENEYNSDDLREIWAYFRSIATFLLVIIGLVMVIGQAVSKE